MAQKKEQYEAKALNKLNLKFHPKTNWTSVQVKPSFKKQKIYTILSFSISKAYEI